MGFSPSQRASAGFALLALLALLTCGCSGSEHPGATRVNDRETFAAVPTAARAQVELHVVEVAAAAQKPSVCPSGMALVDGNYCPEVEQVCKRWLDPPGRYHLFRCEAYEESPKCKSDRQPMRYCIDVDEQRLAAEAADPRPSNHVSYVEAKQTCEDRGARLCNDDEWQFACEGEEMRPYPYGFVRDATACNIDREGLGGGVGRLHDFRSETGENNRCVSPFGVRDLAGNLEEWASGVPTSPHTHMTLLKGSWWLPGRSTCRATNAGHDKVYEGTETGFRCCAAAGP